MPSRSGAVHVAKIIKKVKGRIYTSYLLRRSFRENGKVKHETLGNISHLPPHLIELVRKALNEEAVPGNWEIERSLPHGHVELVLGVLRDIGLDNDLASKPCRERDLIIAMIVSRIIEPDSKLACCRSLRPQTAAHSLGHELRLGEISDSELYRAMDWLLERQNRIENKLAKKHLSDGTLLLYDISSSYYTGEVGGLVQYGHSRDQKSGLPQIVYGLLCSPKGIPISIEVFSGNTGDPNTLKNQIAKVRKRFGLKRVVIVGDRGMLTSKRIDEEIRNVEGLDWISALRNDAIKKLSEDEAFDRTLFDEVDLAEITSEDYPGERLIVCRNPFLAEKRKHAREALLNKAEEELNQIVAATLRPKRALQGKDKIGVRVGRALQKCKLGKHFTIEITDDRFTFKRNQGKIDAEASLDGIYIIRTSVDKETLAAEETVLAYKNLAVVERAFRCMKQIDLKVRPIYHRLDDRIRAHVFLCMLAFYVEKHLRERIESILFEDEDREQIEEERESAVAPAPRSAKAKNKEAEKKTADGWPVHSFRTILKDMATLCLNRVKPAAAGDGGENQVIYLKTKPTEFQAHVFKLASPVA